LERTTGRENETLAPDDAGVGEAAGLLVDRGTRRASSASRSSSAS
jgi:hypothetical protein